MYQFFIHFKSSFIILFKPSYHHYSPYLFLCSIIGIAIYISLSSVHSCIKSGRACLYHVRPCIRGQVIVVVVDVSVEALCQRRAQSIRAGKFCSKLGSKRWHWYLHVYAWMGWSDCITAHRTWLTVGSFSTSEVTFPIPVSSCTQYTHVQAWDCIQYSVMICVNGTFLPMMKQFP